MRSLSAAVRAGSSRALDPKTRWLQRGLSALKRIARFSVIARKQIGVRATYKWIVATFQYKLHLPCPKYLNVRPLLVAHPFKLRAATSASFIFRQFMIENEYAPLKDLAPATILDLGANIGLASIWFLNRFPEANVLAIEAEAGNFNLCRQNLSPYLGRARVLHGAAWSSRTKLTLRTHTCQADNTVHAEIGDNVLEGWDVCSLIELSGFKRVGLLKIDIEGSERALFRENSDRWLPLVDTLCIELHGHECRNIFFEALRSYRYEHLQSGELDILRNVRPKNHSLPGQHNAMRPFSGYST